MKGSSCHSSNEHKKTTPPFARFPPRTLSKASALDAPLSGLSDVTFSGVIITYHLWGQQDPPS